VLTELLGAPAAGPPKILRVDDSVHDMHAFLRLLRFAAPSSGYPPPFDPNIAQYAGIHRLALKYNGWYPRAVLDFHVELHAAQIVDDLGPDAAKDDVFTLLRLAHALHSSYLWSQVCDRLRFNKWWHAILNPWQFSEADAAALGPSIHSILSILASVSSRTRLYSNLEELCVLYTDGEWGPGGADARGRGERRGRRAALGRLPLRRDALRIARVHYHTPPHPRLTPARKPIICRCRLRLSCRTIGQCTIRTSVGFHAARTDVTHPKPAHNPHHSAEGLPRGSHPAPQWTRSE
jgi:hypothetical protein